MSIRNAVTAAFDKRNIRPTLSPLSWVETAATSTVAADPNNRSRDGLYAMTDFVIGNLQNAA